MRQASFPTAQDAETAFYEALERADLEAMMAVWADDEEIVCVHPGGPRLSGHEQVRESWRKIFAGGGTRIRVTQQVAMQAMMVAVHSVHESAAGEASASNAPGQRAAATVVATNIYLRTAAGWRMLVHHASPAPGQAQPARPDAPKILH